MAIPFVNDRLLKPSRTRIVIDRWFGLNCTDTVANGECTKMKNISSDGTYLIPRPPREVIASGIENPQRLLFCGDRLSYIAGGKLNVQSGESFDEVGEVGNVTSAVDFNNQKMLFYPNNFVYDYKTKELDAVSSELTKTKYVINNDELFYIDYRLKGYAIRLTNDKAAINYKIPANQVEDENGNTEYAGISVNISASDLSWVNATSDDRTVYNCKLFINAYNANNELFGSKVGPYNFGAEIKVDNAAYYEVFVLYYQYENYYVTDNSIAGAVLKKKRNDDLENAKFWLTQSKYPGANSRPTIAYACMDNNRVVAVEGNNFYASCLGDYTNWTDFTDAEGNPKETGAYAEELCTYGNFTGIIKYRNNVIITKKDMLYECYGNKPPYRINLAAKVGCVDCRSMVEVGGVLYWLGCDGVYRYSGGLPVNISQKINPAFGKFRRGCAATDGRRYYIYAVGDEKASLLVYDTQTALWCCEDDAEIVDMTSFDNVVYALTGSGTLYKYNSGSEEFEWEYETKAFDLNSGSKKIPQRLILKVDAALNAGLDIYIRYDNGGYTRIASYSSFKKSVVDIKLKNKVCDSFSLKLCGRGYVRVYGINIEVIGSGKRNNNNYLVRY